MSPEARREMRQAAADLTATTGVSFSMAYATLHTAANIEAEAERRGYIRACEELLTTGPGRRNVPQWLIPVLADMIDAEKPRAT